LNTAARGSEHDRTWTALIEAPDPRVRTIGNDGDGLKFLRTKSDYKLDDVSQNDVLNALRLSKKVRSALSGLK